MTNIWAHLKSSNMGMLYNLPLWKRTLESFQEISRPNMTQGVWGWSGNHSHGIAVSQSRLKPHFMARWISWAWCYMSTWREKKVSVATASKSKNISQGSVAGRWATQMPSESNGKSRSYNSAQQLWPCRNVVPTQKCGSCNARYLQYLKTSQEFAFYMKFPSY